MSNVEVSLCHGRLAVSTITETASRRNANRVAARKHSSMHSSQWDVNVGKSCNVRVLAGTNSNPSSFAWLSDKIALGASNDLALMITSLVAWIIAAIIHTAADLDRFRRIRNQQPIFAVEHHDFVSVAWFHESGHGCERNAAGSWESTRCYNRFVNSKSECFVTCPTTRRKHERLKWIRSLTWIWYSWSSRPKFLSDGCRNILTGYARHFRFRQPTPLRYPRCFQSCLYFNAVGRFPPLRFQFYDLPASVFLQKSCLLCISTCRCEFWCSISCISRATNSVCLLHCLTFGTTLNSKLYDTITDRQSKKHLHLAHTELMSLSRVDTEPRTHMRRSRHVTSQCFQSFQLYWRTIETSNLLHQARLFPEIMSLYFPDFHQIHTRRLRK